MNERKALIERLEKLASGAHDYCKFPNQCGPGFDCASCMAPEISSLRRALLEAVRALSAEHSPDAAQVCDNCGTELPKLACTYCGHQHDAAQGGEQGEVVAPSVHDVCDFVKAVDPDGEHRISGCAVSDLREFARRCIAWDRQNRASHPSQAVAEADEARFGELLAADSVRQNIRLPDDETVVGWIDKSQGRYAGQLNQTRWLLMKFAEWERAESTKA